LPTPRERVLRTLRHEHPGRFPRDIGFTPAVQEKFRAATGAESAEDYFDLEVRRVGPVLLSPQADFRPYYPEASLPANAWFDSWGCARAPGEFFHFTRMYHPLANVTSVSELEEYPWPTIGYAPDAAERVRSLQDQGYAVYGWVSDFFEPAWALRGMDRLMLDFLEAPEIAEYILGKIAEQAVRCAEEAARAGCDVVGFGDDVGMQDRMMMSVPMWREWLFPVLRDSIRAAKAVRPEVHVWYHSDGDIEPIIPGLIEAGIDILNPVQPECVDPVKLRAEYGTQLSFWGCIGTQTTFPFGTPAEMKRVVHGLIETVGSSGGLLLAPTHVLEPEVPWENIVAFFEAIDEAAR
jgi:uroporphyrinogen decarboxylase